MTNPLQDSNEEKGRATTPKHADSSDSGKPFESRDSQNKLLWRPTPLQIEQTQMFRFMKDHVNKQHGLHLSNYFELYDWSVQNIDRFWAACWSYFKIVHSQEYASVIDTMTMFALGDEVSPAEEVDQGSPASGAVIPKWFQGARLNFAENLLRFAINPSAFTSDPTFDPTKHKAIISIGKPSLAPSMPIYFPKKEIIITINCNNEL